MSNKKSIGLISKTSLPVFRESIADLKRANYFLCLVLIGFSLCFMLIFEVPSLVVLGILITGFLYVFTVGSLQIEVLKYSISRFQHQTVIFNLFRYGIGWLLTVVIQFLMHPLFLLIVDRTFSQKPIFLKLILIFIANGFLTAGLFFLMHDYILTRNLKKETELENSRLLIKAEEAKTLLLKKQVHPHFFFNSLNTLKALYKKDQVLGEKYLIHLAEFMRTSVSNHTSQVAKFKEELRLCENYLQMQKVRFGDALNVEIIIQQPEKLEWFLPFFSLQPLLENAIKHNVLTKIQPLKISIVQNEEMVTVSNTLNLKKYKETSTQSGLTNLCERYYIWSRDEVMIYEKNNQFIVECKLYPDESANY